MSATAKKRQFRNKYVVITGAASGIGRQLSKDFYLKEHSHLILLDQNLKGLETLKKDLKNLTHRSHRLQKIKILHCDISAKDSLKETLKKVSITPTDILINNAGITSNGLFENTKIDDFEKVIEINLMSAVRLTKALLPKLLKSKNGVIVNISSLGGLIGMPGMSAYSASKFAVVGFSEALGFELKDRVTVCTICPAFVKTQIANNALLQPLSNIKALDNRVQEMNKILTKLGSNPQKASQTIIQSIQQKKKLTLINPDAHVLFFLKKFLPVLNDTLVHRAFNKLINQGIFKS